jgi:quercetin dioxygenase-like cupin family protein
MKRSFLFMALFIVVGIFGLSSIVEPQSLTPTIVQLTPSEMKWVTPNSLPAGAQLAVVYGNPFKPGLYVMLAKFPANWKNPPHTYPIEQVATVLSGTVYSGLGKTYDSNKLRMFPTGSVYTEPLNTPHFTETREEEVILHITGIGPFTRNMLNQLTIQEKNSWL